MKRYGSWLVVSTALLLVGVAVVMSFEEEEAVEPKKGRSLESQSPGLREETRSTSLKATPGARCRINGHIENGPAKLVRAHSSAAEADFDAELTLGGRAFFLDLPEQGDVFLSAATEDDRTAQQSIHCDGSGVVSVVLRFERLDPSAGRVLGRCLYLETGQPVAGAIVRASLAPQSARIERESRRVLWSATAGDDGAFRASVPPGHYALSCQKDVDEGAPAMVEVRRAEISRIELFVETRASIVGTLRRENGETVPRVRVFGRTARSGSTEVEKSVVTDREGGFMINGFPQGPVIVEAHHEGLFAETQGIARAELPYAELDLVLRPSLSGIKGSVRAVEGYAVDAVRVSAEAISPNRRVAPRAPLVRTSFTGDEGEFELGGLMPGRYLLRASAPTYAETKVEVDVGVGVLETALLLARACTARISVEPATPRVPVVVSVRPAQEGSASGHFPMGRELSGNTGDVLELPDASGTAKLVARTIGSVSRTATTTTELCQEDVIVLTFASSTGGEAGSGSGTGTVLATVKSSDREPVRDVLVRLPPHEFAARTGPDGRARIEDVPPGKYWVTADGGPDWKAVEVESGRVHEIEIELDRAKGDIRGTVTSMGSPVEGAAIFALCADNGAMSNLKEASVQTRTSHAGTFRFTPQGGGICTVRAEHPVKGRSDAVTLTAGSMPATIELHPSVVIEGRILVKDSDRPAIPASLTVRTRGRTSALEMRTLHVTESDGSYRVEGVAPGAVSLSATTDVGNGHLEILLSPGEQVRGVDIFVFGQGTVEGRVVDTQGAPVAGVKMSVVGYDESDGAKFGTVNTSADGMFRLSVPAGNSFRLYASSKGFYPRGTPPFELDPSQPFTRLPDVVLSPRGGPEEKEGGIGVIISADPRGARITRFTEVSPAREAGLQIGDVIVSVDNVPVGSDPMINWVVLIRGLAGTPVILGVERGSDLPFTVMVVRRAVPGLGVLPEHLD